MRSATTLGPALHALRVHRLRTVLGVSGIAIGVAAVILIVIMGSHTRESLQTEIRELGAELLVVLPGAARTQGAWGASGSLHSVTEGDGEAILHNISTVAAVAPLLRGAVQVVSGNRNKATIMRGVTPHWFAARPWPVIQGRQLSPEDVHRSAKVALIAAGLAKALFDRDDPTGRTIRIDQVPFLVIGVLQEVGHTLGGEDLDDQVLIPITTARKRILGFTPGHPSAVGGLTLRVANGGDMSRAVGEIRHLLRERHRLAGGSPDDFLVRDLAAAQRAELHADLVSTAMLAAAAGVALIVAGTGIMNLMLVSISERRQEIGLRMAIGARPAEIAAQFLIEAASIAVIGSGVGLGLAVGLALVAGLGSGIATAATGWAVLGAVSAATLITLLSALYPARRAARSDPATVFMT